MNKSCSNLGKWLVEACQREGLSLRQAAVKTNLSHGTIRDIMNGNCPASESIKKLADAFGGNGQEGLSLEDQLLVMAGFRSPRPPGQEISQPLARLLDRLSKFSEPRLRIVDRFIEFISEVDKE